MSPEHKKTDISKVVFWLALLYVFFIVSGEFAVHGWQPWKLYAEGYTSAKALIKQSLLTRPEILEKNHYAGNGVTRYNETKAYNGLTLMQGWFPEGLEVRLVDMSGKVVHRWPIDFFKIWKNSDHIFPKNNMPATKFNTHSQGMWLLPDGSLIFNLAGLVKMDKCGIVKWKVARMTHHSVTPDHDGSFWVPVNSKFENLPNDMLLSGVSNEVLSSLGGEYEDRILHVGTDGRILNEYSVLRALIDGGFERELFDVSRISKFDPTHLNDIEIVTPELAEKIRDVMAGDLLVSIRQMHMIAIMDKDNGKIKWHHVGPWIRQHDPDITAEGNIELFNNNREYWAVNTATGRKPQSNILAFDPSTGITSTKFKGKGESAFYTDIMGSHQVLKNGNRLIVESKRGRVFEVSDSGDIVWEYVKPYDKEYASLIEYAIRYESSYFTVKEWNCH